MYANALSDTEFPSEELPPLHFCKQVEKMGDTGDTFKNEFVILQILQ